MTSTKHPITPSSSMMIIIGLMLVTLATGNDNMRVAYEWKEMDFKYASVEDRWSAIERHEFKPNNVIPFGLEVYGSRLFLTLPRWKDGVPASLAYIDLNDNSTKSPALIPFPSWQAHNLAEPELVSPFRVRADRCGRLWVLDSRIDGVLEHGKLFGAAQLLVYDLHNDNLLRRHIFPDAFMKEGSFYSSLAVEDGDCDNAFAYAGDLGAPGLVVYSWSQDASWRVQHHYFHPDPLAGNYSIDGIDFQWDDGLYGLALSKPGSDGYSTLYFHPLSSTMEFSVSTMVLRNKTLATSTEIYRDFQILGSRGPNAQAGASFYDQSRGVLFYALPNLNAVACWKATTSSSTSSSSNQNYTIKSQGRVYMSAVEMVFPSDVKIDTEDRLWVLSNRLHEFIYEELYPNAANFRILTANVKDAIENTACDSPKTTRPLPELINKLDDVIKTITNPTTPKPDNNVMRSAGVMHHATTIAILVGFIASRATMWSRL